MKSCFCLAIFVCLFFCPSEAHAQNRNGGRQRVGVALSGGSALGLAHIGVIRYFEEHHIPIDDIAGTSMGGLVGGFYAIGMDSAELTHMVNEADWDALLSATPRFLDRPVVDKQGWYRPAGNLSLRFGRHFSLPAGLNPGIPLSLFLSRNTLAYSSVTDFDDLPTPFRCVATDLVTGERVVLKQGVLARALRATMSLPAVFTPVTLDGMVLVDGGVVENIPVEVVREMGAHFVIAVTLTKPRVDAERLKTVSDVLRQTIDVLVSQNEQRSLAHADLVISVDTARFSGSDYQKSVEIIQAGYEAAKRKAADLKRFELSAEDWAQHLELRQGKIRPARNRGAVVQVSAPNLSFQEKAKGELERKLGGGIVDERELDDVLKGMLAATAVPTATYAGRRVKMVTKVLQFTLPGGPAAKSWSTLRFCSVSHLMNQPGRH
jgi:NTE family protein